MSAKKFVVKRSEWRRGKGPFGSLLCRKDGMKCCLGFMGKQLGIDESSMGVGYPHSLESGLLARFPALPISDSWRGIIHWEDFAHINDDPNLSDDERETELKKLAERAGFEFEFIP